MLDPLLTSTPKGLYCPLGDFYIDPWRPVERAVITHAHGDHLRGGHGRYWCSAPGRGITEHRLGFRENIVSVDYREPIEFNNVRVSLHPAGHILGSAQVRIEAQGEVWVVSGDYKRNSDPTCEPFEVVPCDTFITEATFALPLYRWKESEKVAQDILSWWQENRREGHPTVLFCYSLGKAQRILAELAKLVDWTAYLHGGPAPLVEAYRAEGVKMLPTQRVFEMEKSHKFEQDLILAPPSAYGTSWMKRFRRAKTGFASGWMHIRGNRRRKAYDRGFVLSDHADWPDLLRTIEETGAKQIIATHGNSETLAQFLREKGKRARTWSTEFHPENEETGGEE